MVARLTSSETAGLLEHGTAPAARRQSDELVFLCALYLGSFLVRLFVGMTIYLAGYLDYFAADAYTYDYWAWGLARYWNGELQNPAWLLDKISKAGLNGMYYWVAAIYFVGGRSLVAATVTQIVLVSWTPVIVYKIARRIYASRNVARLSSLLTAFLPSMVIWSSTLLKDPIVVLLLSVAVFYTLKLQQELKVWYAAPILAATLLIFPFRGYVFYFMMLAVVGSLLLARFGGDSLVRYLVRAAAILVVAAALFLLRFDRIASQQLNPGLLESIQASRADLAERARSGYRAETDVGTLEGAVRFLPKGVVFLLFAPFPWQVTGTRAALAIPEMLLWYGLFPFCLIGMLHTMRHYLRTSMVVVLFVIQLTLFYAVFIGNVGTAHRQRTQILIFYLIFTAVGLVYVGRRRRGRRDVADAT